MKQLDQKYLDNRIDGVVKDVYIGMRPPTGGRTRLVKAAGAASSESWSRKLRPDWLSASVARQLREKQLTINDVKYSHIVSGPNLRFAW